MEANTEEKTTVVIMDHDYKTSENKLKKFKATIHADGSAEIFPDTLGAKSFRRKAGEWLSAEEFEHSWHLAISEIIEAKVNEASNADATRVDGTGRMDNNSDAMHADDAEQASGGMKEYRNAGTGEIVVAEVVQAEDGVVVMAIHRWTVVRPNGLDATENLLHYGSLDAFRQEWREI